MKEIISEPVADQTSLKWPNPALEAETTTVIGPDSGGLVGVPQSIEPLTKKDFTAANEVRWCPGCGDYAILAAFQSMLPTLGIKRENVMVVSGIGCSSRFPYYMETYGIHSIHGRAPAIATGIAVSRPDLSVWVITGDGDALSIGGNHFIHALRRNVNINILLFNNRIYGLTKGQYSPTSEQGKITKSSPMGSLDAPLNPVSVALGANATFVARVVDSDRKMFTEVLQKAADHRGGSVIEIFQNCPIFNDGAFDALKGPESQDNLIRLVDNEPIRFGKDQTLGVFRHSDSSLGIGPVSEVGEESLVVHDSTLEDPTQAFALSQLTTTGVMLSAPVGIFRNVHRPVYSDEVHNQIGLATQGGEADLQTLLNGKDTWLVV